MFDRMEKVFDELPLRSVSQALFNIQKATAHRMANVRDDSDCTSISQLEQRGYIR